MGEKDREDYSTVDVINNRSVGRLRNRETVIAIERHRNGYWWIIQNFLPISTVKIISEKVTEEILPKVQWSDLKKSIEHDKQTTDNLLNRIGILENEKANQMEHLLNVVQSLEDYKRNNTNLLKEYKNKITEVATNNLEIRDMRSDMYNELKIMKQQLEKLQKLYLEVNFDMRNGKHDELKIIEQEFKKLHKLYLEVQSCCNANANAIANHDLKKQVEKILLDYFPSGTSREDLTRIIRNLLTSRDRDLPASSSNNTNMSDERVRKIVKEILQIYDADKTGQVDYALESAGGQVISTRCTQKYDIKSRAVSLFGYPLYYESNNPRTVIQGNAMQPGVCWAFQDFPGYLLIQLRSMIYVTGFTLEHVSKLILPNENMASAPKKFNVWGLTGEHDPDPIMFGDYEFTMDNNLQYFPVQNKEINRPYEYVELRIHSNYGQLEYTCLYRFRVHGKAARN